MFGFKNNNNSPSLHSVLYLTHSMPLGLSKILFHHPVSNFELVGWGIVISRSSDNRVESVG